jgi:hypothetical protein
VNDPLAKRSRGAEKREIQGERIGENQDFSAPKGGSPPFFIYVLVIIEERKIIATFSLHSRAMICNI